MGSRLGHTLRCIAAVPIFMLPLVFFPQAAWAASLVTDTVIGAGEATYDGQPLVVGNGTDAVTVTIDGTHAFSSLTILSKARLTHRESDSVTVRGMDLTVSGDVDIAAGGAIDVSGRGYLGGKSGGNGSDFGLTVGNATAGGSSIRSGGSHGGLGGWGDGSAIGSAYDELTDPAEPGGGGGGYYASFANRPGGDGGGLVRMTVGGTLTHDGTIAANGNNGGSGNGGGAGGGIYISASAFSGSGTIAADGGQAGTYGGANIGGGGGGRIAVHYTNKTFSGTVSARGGPGNAGGGVGGAGTVYWKAAGQNYGEVFVDNGGRIPAEASTPFLDTPQAPSVFAAASFSSGGRGLISSPRSVTGTLSLDDGWINLGFEQHDAGDTLLVDTLTLVNSSNITHQQTGTAAVYKVDVQVTGSMSVDATSTIEVSGRGYLGGKSGGNGSDFGLTVGNATTGGSSIRSGGSHGGLGGWGDGSAIGTAYDELTDPAEPGGGGGGYYASFANRPGGDGGGLVRMTVGGTLTHDGTIAANGNNGGSGNGGGAGGGIYISASAFSGSGTIAADGGQAGTYGGANIGGGGGGRIAMHYTNKTFSGTVSARGGPGNAGGGVGGAGTVYWKAAGQSYGDLVADNGSRVPAEASTPLLDTAQTPTVFDTLTISNNARFYGATLSSVTGALVVDHAWLTLGYLQHAGGSRLLASTASLTNGAKLTHVQTSTGAVYKVDLHVTGDMTLDAASNIEVNGRGYLGGRTGGNDSEYGRTAGNTTSGGSNLRAGGSHGGYGGWGDSANIARDYGNLTDPWEPGSGGGGYYSSYADRPGGDGGGLIRLVVDGTLTHEGAIVADGLYPGSGGNGGGAGGSVYINAATLTGSGSIRVRGGQAGAYAGNNIGGGGGGRIAVYSVTDQFSGEISARGGKSNNNGGHGGAGSIFRKRADQSHGDLRIDNAVVRGVSTDISGNTLTDSSVAWSDNGLVGYRINPDTDQAAAFGVSANTATTVTASGTVTGLATTGSPYLVYVPTTNISTPAPGRIHTGTATGATATVVTDTAAGWTSGSLVGFRLNPDRSQPETFAILANDATSITVDGDMSAVAAAGKAYAVGKTRFDEVVFTGGAFVGFDDLPLTAQVLTVQENAVVTHVDATMSSTARLEVSAGMLTIETSGRIDTRGRGYLGARTGGNNSEYGFTAGNTTSGGSRTRAGGSHGGAGGSGSNGIIGATYDDALDPRYPGAGGGGYYASYSDRPGGDGGGVVRLTVSETLAIDGVLTADGINPGSNGNGGGAGGALFIDAAVLTGRGTITARGGNAGTYAVDAKGGGGGGRIAIYLNQGSTFLGSVSASGGSGTGGGGPGGDGSLHLNPAGVDISVVQTDSPDPVDTGDALTYTITVTNAGAIDATGVTLIDTLPAGVSFSTATPTQGSCSAQDGVVTCALGEMAAGAEATVTITVSVTDQWTFANAVSVTATQLDLSSANNLASESTVINPADLDLTMSADVEPAIPGEPLVYTLTIANNGWQDAQDLVLSDNLPSALLTPEYTVDGANTWNPWTGSVNLGTLANTAVQEVRIRGTVNPAVTASVSNTASVSSLRSDPDPANNTATVNTTFLPRADLSIVHADAPDPVVPGTALTYTFTIANAGPSDATHVTLTDTVPPAVSGAAYSRDAGATWTPWSGSLDIGTLVPGASQEVRIRATVLPATIDAIENAAGVSSAVVDPAGTDNETGPIVTAVNPTADLAVTMAGGPNPVVVDYDLTYEVNLTNQGPSDAVNVVLSDALPGALSDTRYSLDGGMSWSPWNGVRNLGTLVSGAAQRILLRGGVSAGAAGPLTNNCGVASDTLDPDTANNGVTGVETAVIAAPPEEIFTANTVIGALDFTYDGRHITVGDGMAATTVTIDGAHAFASVTVQPGAVLTHEETDAVKTHFMALAVDGDLTIMAGGAINVNGRGFLGGQRPGNASDYGRTVGNTTAGGSFDADGGSYGGIGGNGSGGGAICAAHGEITDPADPGSGGGGWDGSHPGGDGGGVIRLSVGGTLTNDGVITAGGGTPAAGLVAGGGSGGGIRIETGSLAGGGIISADGGAGGTYCCGYNSGGGGGGRITVDYTNNAYTGSLSARGGAGYNGGGAGGAGTIFMKQAGQPYGDLVVDNAGRIPATDSTPLSPAPDIYRSVRVTGAARMMNTTITRIVESFILDNGWYKQDSPTLTLQLPALNAANAAQLLLGVDRAELPTLILSNGSVLRHLNTTDTQTYHLTLQVAGSMVIDADSRVDADGQGYLGGRRPGNASDYGRTVGNTTAGGSFDADGGSYGGIGGNGSGGGAICVAHGEITDPADPGSGGGAWDDSHPGGDGGGVIRLSVGGTLTNDGVITAGGGTPAAGLLAGGGSGGGIRIETGSLAGGGIISADGGAGGTYCCGYNAGGGGGGSIAVYYTSNAYTGSMSAHGGAGYNGGGAGGAGTIFTKGPAHTYGALLVDNDSLAVLEGSTPLPAGALAYETLTISRKARVQAAHLTWVGSLAVDDAWLTLDCTGQPLTVGTLALTGGAGLTHPATTIDTTHRLDVSVTGDTTIDADSTIDLRARGYLGGWRGANASDSGRTSGNTTAGGSSEADGGSHGGFGGNGSSGSIGLSYGDLRDPSAPGAGGGAWDSSHPAGDGGGLLRLSVSGTLTLDGAIIADGGTPASGRLAGGGAGGGISIRAGELTGSGSVSAVGGGGGAYCCGYNTGGGGGGRIAVRYGAESFTGTTAAHGGAGYNGGGAGGAGTIFWKGKDQAYGDLLVDNNAKTSTTISTPVLPMVLRGVSDADGGIAGAVLTDSSAAWTPGALTGMILNPDRNGTDTFVITGNTETTVTADGDLSAVGAGGAAYAIGVGRFNTVSIGRGAYVGLGDLPLIAGIVDLNDQATVSHPDIGTTGISRVAIRAANMTIDPTSRIDVTGRGYLGGYHGGNNSNVGHTAGNTTTGGSAKTAGGSHGNLGGTGYQSGAPGPAYGSDMAPSESGAGGGGWDGSNVGGDGGGFVSLIVSGTLTHNGTISANGASAGSGILAGGGAGGAIFINAGTIGGIGAMTAAGGSGGSHSYGSGGGAGGRIAYLWGIDNYTGTVAVTGGSGVNGGTDGGDGTVYTGQRQFADISVSMADSPDPSSVGADLTYIITVTNNGPAGATGVTLTDTLPAELTLVTTSATQGSCSGTVTVTCDLGSLANGAGAQVTLVVTPTAAATVVNAAAVSVDQAVLDPAKTTASAATVVYASDASADLCVAIADSPDPVTAGQALTYTVTITNDGPFDAVNTVLNQVLSAQILDPLYSLDGGGTWQSWTGTAMVGTLAASTSAQVRVRGTVHSSAIGLLSTTVSVASDTADPDPADNTATSMSTVVAGADLMVTQSSAPSPVAAGEVLTTTVTVANAGPSDALGVTLTAAMPSAIAGRQVSLDHGSTWSAFGGTLDIGTVAAGSARTVLFRGTVSLDATGAIGQSVTVASATTDPDTTFNTAGPSSTAVTTRADLGVTVSGSPNPVTMGDPLTYQIQVSNGGPSHATGVSATLALPAGVSVISAVSGQGACSGTATVTCDVGALPLGAQVAVTVVATTQSTGVMTATAGVSGTDPDGNATNNTASAVTTVSSNSDLSVSQIVLSPETGITDGQLVTITATVTNLNESPSVNPFVVDFFVDGGSLGTTPVGGSLAGGTSVLVSRLWTAAPGSHTIAVVADSTDSVIETDESNNAGQLAPLVVGASDLSVSGVSWTPDSPVQGERVTFTATIHNGGAATQHPFAVFFAIDGGGIGTVSVDGGIGAGETRAVTQIWTAADGVHSLTVSADSAGVVSETDENNNQLSQALPAIATPDLTVTGITFDPLQPEQGQSVILTATVTNAASTTFTDFQVAFSVDGAPIGSVTVSGGLAAGAQTQVSRTWTAAAGVHVVQVSADDTRVVTEVSEENNTAAITLPDIPKPDLTVDAISWAPAAPSMGETVTLTATVANGGGGTRSAIGVEFTVDGGVIGAGIIGGGLPGGGSVAVTRNWTATPGTHTVSVTVDRGAQIPETNEGNNVRSQTLPAILAPDLTVSQVAWTPSAPIDGQPVTLSAVVDNTGSGSVLGTFYVQFKVGGVSVGTVPVSQAVAGGASVPVSTVWTAVPGTHAVTVSADVTQQIVEDSETNNVGSGSISAIAAADLKVAQVTWTPDPPVEGEEAVFTATVENIGAGATQRYFGVGFAVDGTLIDRRTVFGMSAGAQQVVSTPWAGATGQHQLTVTVDDGAQVIESDETNNVLSRALPYIADATAPSAPTLAPVASPTNKATQTLSGTKEEGTSIWVNGARVVPLDNATTWSYPVNLALGENRFAVSAKDAAGNQSAPVNGVIIFDNTAPAAVNTVTVDTDGDGTFVWVHWAGYDLVTNSDVAFFRLYIGTAPYSSVDGLTALVSVPTATATYKVDGLSRATTYYIAVVAVDRAGNVNNVVIPVVAAPVDTTAPANVTQLQVSSFADRLVFGWTPPPDTDLAGYRIYFDGAADPVVLTTGQTAYEATGLEPASVHLLRVTAVDIGGNESGGVSKVGVTVLPNPVDLTASARSGAATLTWTGAVPSAYVKNYAIYLSTADFSSVAGMTPALQVTGTTATLTGLVNGTVYYAAVTTVNTSGGQGTSVATVTVTPVQRPEIVGVKANYISPVSAVADFRVTVVFDSTMNGITPVITVAGSGSTNPTVPPGGTWLSTRRTNDTYVTPDIALVQGMDGTLVVGVSGAVDASANTMLPVDRAYTFTLDATPPAAPTPTVLSQGCGSAIVSWAAYSPPADLAGYQVYLSKGSSFGDVTGRSPVGWAVAGKMTYTVTGLEVGADYFAAVVAVDKTGNKLNPVTPVALRSDNAIAPPLSAAVASGADPGVAVISWPALNPATTCGAAGYMLYYQDAAFASVTGLVPNAILGIGEEQITIEGLDRARTYYFAVVGFNTDNAFNPVVSPTMWSDPYTGEITSDTVMGGGTQKSIPVNRPIVVTNGATLTLAAGTRLYFAPGTGITVASGKVVIEGTALAPVVLTSQKDQPGGAPRPGDWTGLTLGAGADGSVLRHVIVRYAGGVTVDAASSLTLEALSAVYNIGPGLLAKNGATVTATQALIAYNHTGLRLEDTAQLTVSQSVIKGNTINAVSAGTQALSATGNWWGSPDVARIVEKISGQVTYDNFMVTEPLLTPAVGIAGGDTSVGTRSVGLLLACRTAAEMRISENSAFSGVFFQPFSENPVFTLSEGGGSKTIFVEFRSASGGVSQPIMLTVDYITGGPVIGQFNLSEGDTLSRPMMVSAQATAALGITAVEFYVDGQLINKGAASPYTYRWDVRNLPNGIHRVKLLVRDGAGNLAAAERNVHVDVTPPPAPVITAPTNGAITASDTITVRGTAEPLISVQITRNGYVMATIQAGADGGFEIPGLGLTEGGNIIAATAQDAVGQSPVSNEVGVAMDSGAPAAPIVLDALVRPWGGIDISWQYAESGERPVRFDLYRHGAFFTDTAEANLVVASLSRMDHIDHPDTDGTFYYGVVGRDAAGNVSSLSNLVTADYDRTSPAFTVAFTPAPPYGPGGIAITVSVDEPLDSAPTLTILPSGTTAPKSVTLAADGALSYTGTFTVTEATPSGTAVVNVSGKDAAGNSFYGTPQGAAFVIDTAGPTGAVAVDAAAPVQVQTERSLQVTLTLNEAVKDGTTPGLRFAPPEGADVTVALSGGGTVWSGILALNSTMGKGSGRFLLTAQDALSNPGTRITGGETLEIYNTEFPDPTTAPTQLAAVPKIGGDVTLSWNAVAGAEGYRVYRSAGDCLQSPGEVVGDAVTAAAFTDHPTPDGTYCYGVSADRKGAESTLSTLVSVLVDGTPPAPPENVAVAFGEKGVRVSWDAPSAGEVSAAYGIYRNGAKIRTVNGLARSINDFPPAGGQYSYQVASVDWFGNEQLSAPVVLNLNVGAVSNFEALVREGEIPRFTWENADAGVIGYNIYRSGIRLNSGLITANAFADALYAGNSRVSYAVRAVNASGEESPPCTVDIFPVGIAALTNPDADGSGRSMVAGYFNVVALSVTNRETTYELNLDQIHLDVTAGSGSPLVLTRSVDWRISPGGGRSEDLVLPVGDTVARDLAVTLRQPFEGGSRVIYKKTISVSDIARAGVSVDLSTASVPLAGGYATVRMCINNHGFADMDLVVSRGASPGDLFVVVKNADGLHIGRTNYNGTPEGTRLSLDKRGYVTIDSGGARCMDIDVLVPENLAAGELITFEGGVGGTYFDMGTSGELAGGALTAAIASGISHAPYYGTAGTDQSVYVNDGRVVVSGQAIDRQTQQPVPDTPLKLGFYCRGFKWFQEVTTDDQGSYSYTYVPTRGMSGHFIVWAAHPDVFDTLTQAQFDVYRLYHSPERGEIRMSKADSLDFQIELFNPGERALTGFSTDFRAFTADAEGAEIDTVTVTGQVLVDAGSFTLTPGQKKRVTLRIAADAEAPSAVNVEYRMRFTPDVTAVFTATALLTQAVPILSVVTPKAGYVDLSLDRGALVSRQISVKNIGLDTLQGLEIIPPSNVSWMTLNVAKNASGKYLLGDVAPGASVTFDVVFAPPADTAFGYHQDQIVLRGSNVSSDYQICLYGRVTSNKLGAVKFSVINILGQELMGATIRMRNTALGQDTAPVKTDMYGEALVTDIQEGGWSWQVTAPGHGNDVGVVQVSADQTQFVESLLARNLVTINFKVEPVPYTDRYEIKLEQTFETHVPVPVLVVDPSIKDLGTIRDGFETTYMVNVSNFGLKQMEDVELTTGVTTNSRLEPLVKYLPVLGAMQTVQIPYRYTFNTHLSNAGQTDIAAQSIDDPSDDIVPAGIDRASFATAQGATDWAKDEAKKYSSCWSDFVDPREGIEALETIGAQVMARGYCADSTTPLAVGAGLMAFAAVTGAAENVIIGTVSCLINSVRGILAQIGIGGGSSSGGRGSGKPLKQSGSAVDFARDPACFAGDTPIAMADGTARSIEQIRAGDRILSLTGGADRVRRVYSRTVDRVRELWIAASGSGEIRRLVTTDEHLFRLKDRGWTLARNIAVGDAVVLTGGVTGKVVYNESVARRERVYNFEVDGGHAYYANGSLVYERCWNAGEDPFDTAATGKGRVVSQNSVIEAPTE